MCRLSQKLLALVVSLLIGALPYPSVFADVTSSLDVGEATSKMADMDLGPMDIQFNQAADHCDQCVTDDCCAGDVCSSGHCTSGAFALLSVVPFPTNLVTTSSIVRVADGFVSNLPATLFRPPRA